MMVTTLPLVLVPLALVLVLSSWLAGASIRTLILERLDYSSQQINDRFDRFTNQMEDIMRPMIINVDVQESLTQSAISHGRQNRISGFLKLYNYGAIRDIFYMDNRGNIVQTHEVSAATLESISESHIQSRLSGTYAQQVWTFHDDDISGDEGQFLFISRYVRHLDLNVDPGLLIFKIDPEILDSIFDHRIMVAGADYVLLDHDNRVVYHNTHPEWIGRRADAVLANREVLEILSEPWVPSAQQDRYLFSHHVNRRTGWKILGVVPYRTAMSQLRRTQLIFYLIMLIAAVGTMTVVYLTTIRFTEPISELEHAMHAFRDGKFNTRVTIVRNDEIGEMARSYNLMADEISTLLDTIRKDQEALTTAELESLAYQINPHFVYNTLDNVHMLARTAKDDRITQLILSLTKFLRISLSKGHKIIKLMNEFEHVKHYLNIQKIRFGDTFDFQVSLDPEIAALGIVKFILQPLAENSVSHGFQDMESGGFVTIVGRRIDGKIEIRVEDNGSGIDEETRIKLNGLFELSPDQILEAFSGTEGGYGVGNVIARLKIYYGRTFRLRYDEIETGGVRCTLLFDELSADIS